MLYLESQIPLVRTCSKMVDTIPKQERLPALPQASSPIYEKKLLYLIFMPQLPIHFEDFP